MVKKKKEKKEKRKNKKQKKIKTKKNKKLVDVNEPPLTQLPFAHLFLIIRKRCSSSPPNMPCKDPLIKLTSENAFSFSSSAIV